MIKLIHLTDPHLMPPGEALYGLDPEARLRGAIDHVAAHHSDADCMVLTGDLAHWGDAAAYALLQRELVRLPFPAYPLIGNHDQRAAFQEAFLNIGRDPNGFVQYRIDTAAGRLLMLDTVQEGTHAGWYDTERQAWLRAELDAAALEDQPVYLFAHHPPFPIHIRMMDMIRMVQADEMAALLAQTRADIRHYFFGHVHRPVSGSWRGIPFSTLYGTNHQVALDFGPEDDAPMTHEAPAYNIAFLGDGLTVIHTCSYTYDGPMIDHRTDRNTDQAARAAGRAQVAAQDG